MEEIKIYYLYRHIRVDKNEPFYIGKGSVYKRNLNAKIDKTYYTRAYEKCNRGEHWKNIKNITEYEVEILFESIDEDFIFEKEIEFIALYGRSDLNKGILCNKDNGGKNGGGYSDTTKKEWSKKRSGKNNYMYGKTGELHPNFGKKLSPEERKEISDRNSGKNSYFFGKKGMDHPSWGMCSIAAHRALIEKNTGRPRPQSVKDAVSEAHKGAKCTFAESVIDTVTLQEWDNVKQAAIDNNIPYINLMRYIRGEIKNKTNIIYKFEYEGKERVNKGNQKEPWNQKNVINTETKDIFTSIKKASQELKCDTGLLSEKLRGLKNNDTTYMLLSEYQKLNPKT